MAITMISSNLVLSLVGSWIVNHTKVGSDAVHRVLGQGLPLQDRLPLSYGPHDILQPPWVLSPGSTDPSLLSIRFEE